jgi:hypothetical protein
LASIVTPACAVKNFERRRRVDLVDKLAGEIVAITFANLRPDRVEPKRCGFSKAPTSTRRLDRSGNDESFTSSQNGTRFSPRLRLFQ